MSVNPVTDPHPLATLRRTGTVDNIVNAPTTIGVVIGGDDPTNVVDVPYLESYAPQVGDTVVMLTVQGDSIVVGGLAPTGKTWTTLSLNAGFSANTFGYAPAYSYANGRVELRGNVSKSTAFSATTTNFLTLPNVTPTIWPAEICDFACALQAQGTNPYTARVELSTLGVMGVIMPSPFGGTWVSLDGIFYDTT